MVAGRNQHSSKANLIRGVRGRNDDEGGKNGSRVEDDVQLAVGLRRQGVGRGFSGVRKSVTARVRV